MRFASDCQCWCGLASVPLFKDSCLCTKLLRIKGLRNIPESHPLLTAGVATRWPTKRPPGGSLVSVAFGVKKTRLRTGQLKVKILIKPTGSYCCSDKPRKKCTTNGMSKMLLCEPEARTDLGMYTLQSILVSSILFPARPRRCFNMTFMPGRGGAS